MPLTLAGDRHPLASPAAQCARLSKAGPVVPFDDRLAATGLGPLVARDVQVLQLNLGKMCNQTCKHCHVDAGPDRREVMDRATIEAALRALENSAIPTVDLTGGAPELNPHFRWLVERVRALGRRVIDRCNLTILMVGAYRDLPEFLADHRVEIVASLPYYQARNTDAQRGAGVFDDSIAALQRLNALGYGIEGSGLELALVYNPTGAFLPPRQSAIEPDFRRELRRRFGVEFNRLFAITNMPISRFLEFLERTGQVDEYLRRLSDAYNPATVEGLMCRTTLSVGWDGALYDCDFNQMLDLRVVPTAPRTIFDYDAGALAGRPIVTGPHCYGCTAGAGSSCGGEVAT